jgi:hypothetical protein
MSAQPDPGVPLPSARLWSPIAVLALLGGVAAAVGVFLPWADPSRVTLHTQEFIDNLASGLGLDPTAFPIPAGAQSLTDPIVGAPVPGRADMLGLGTALSGFVAIVGAVLALGMPEGRMRRIGGAVAAVAGVVAIALAGAAWSDTSGLVREELIAQVRAEADRQLAALLPGVPLRGLITGPLLDRVEASLRSTLEVEAGAASGLFLSLGGGIAAALGGLAVVLREMPAEAPVDHSLRAIVAQMSDAERRDLLRVLVSSDETRAEAVQTFCELPGKGSWKPIFEELERDHRLRRDVTAALRTVGATDAGSTAVDAPRRDPI